MGCVATFHFPSHDSVFFLADVEFVFPKRIDKDIEKSNPIMESGGLFDVAISETFA